MRLPVQTAVATKIEGGVRKRVMLHATKDGIEETEILSSGNRQRGFVVPGCVGGKCGIRRGER